MAFAERYIVKPGKAFSLSGADPGDKTGLPAKEGAAAEIAEHAKAIDALQDRLYAEGKRALLVVLQGTDTSGKDGTIRGVFNSCGPLGVQVTSFKVPSEEERSHDYLWRVHKACPPKGIIGIFNRSHYEDVLVVKVRKFAPAEAIERRYEEINAFEKTLADNGTRILKFMLDISKEEQGERLQDRLDDPAKVWKFKPGDLEDRKLWDDYREAYEIALNRCSTAHAPWHVVPSDRKWARNAVISRIARETLEEMNPQYPPAGGFDPKAIKVD